MLCLYNPGIRCEPFLDGSAFLFLPAFLNPYVVVTGFPCDSSTKSLRSYVPGTGVSCWRKRDNVISICLSVSIQYFFGISLLENLCITMVCL